MKKAEGKSNLTKAMEALKEMDYGKFIAKASNILRRTKDELYDLTSDAEDWDGVLMAAEKGIDEISEDEAKAEKPKAKVKKSKNATKAEKVKAEAEKADEERRVVILDEEQNFEPSYEQEAKPEEVKDEDVQSAADGSYTVSGRGWAAAGKPVEGGFLVLKGSTTKFVGPSFVKFFTSYHKRRVDLEKQGVIVGDRFMADHVFPSWQTASAICCSGDGSRKWKDAAGVEYAAKKTA